MFKKVQYIKFISLLIIYSIVPFTLSFCNNNETTDENLPEVVDLSNFYFYDQSNNKKLILTSNYLNWKFVRDNIQRMETEQPGLNGVATGVNGPFDKKYLILRGDKKWTEKDVQIDVVSEINWNLYKENFVVLYFGDNLPFDFFNDDKWSVILYNATMVSKMLSAGRFKGIFLDNENYYEGSHGWKYDPSWFPKHTFEQVRKKVRERGFQFMKSIQQNFEDPLIVLDFIWFGDFWNDYDSKTSRQILWLAFKDGMLDAATPEDVFVDTNEMAYYYQESSMFTDIYRELRLNRFPKYGASDLQEKYKKQVQVGHGIYPSLYYNRFTRWPFTYNKQEQDIYWKSQLYNSLLTSDEYVWIWTEEWDWWGEGEIELPENFTSIINEVKGKMANQEGVGFDLINHSPNWEINLVKPVQKFHVATSPTINIISPQNKSELKGNFIIENVVSENTKRVEFYINSMLVKILKSSPFNLKVENLAPGNYTIFTRAFDYNNEHTTSAPIIIKVN